MHLIVDPDLLSPIYSWSFKVDLVPWIHWFGEFIEVYTVHTKFKS